MSKIPSSRTSLHSLTTERTAAGISNATFERATRGLTRDPEVVERAATQPEHDLTAGSYVTRLVSETRVATGRERLSEQATSLQAIEARYGVDRHVLVAIWGVEVHVWHLDRPAQCGPLPRHAGPDRCPPDRLLASRVDCRADDPGTRRCHAPRTWSGSWAGAIGQTQFMPTTFRAHAVDFDGDGRRDLWRNAADALASAANYLAASGWRRGEPWGFEVTLPDGFDLALSGIRERRPSLFWRDHGVAPANAKPWPDRAVDLRLILPAGAAGPAFLVGASFDAVLRYNPAISYALAVCHLADRLGGAPPIATPWPEGDRGLRKAEREELQRLLTAAGYDPGPVDGVLGGLTRAALRSYQKSSALPPDGHPSASMLERLRAELASAPR